MPAAAARFSAGCSTRANAACAVSVRSELAPSIGSSIIGSLAADALSAFLARHDHPRLGINYDCGNSTWFGFDPDDEVPAYGAAIRNVHIKDCTKADYSVPLGRGETRFDAVFGQLAAQGYRGDFVMQAARQPDDIAAARDYLAFGRALVARHLA